MARAVHGNLLGTIDNTGGPSRLTGPISFTIAATRPPAS